MPAALLFLPPLRRSCTTIAMSCFLKSLFLRIIPPNCSFMVIVTPDYSCFVPPKTYYQFVCIHGFSWPSVPISTLINFIFLSLYSYSTQVYRNLWCNDVVVQCNDVNIFASPVHFPYKGFSAKMNIYLVMKS